MPENTKVYVAGSSKECPRARFAMRYLGKAGLRVTYDWTEDIAGEGCSNPPAASDTDRRRWSMCDLEAIQAADVVLFLGTDKASMPGAHTELGFSLGLKKKVYWAGHRPSIFNYLADAYFENDQDALRYLATKYGSDTEAAGELRQ